MAVDPREPAQSEQKSGGIFDQGKEEKDHERGIEGLCGEEDGQREIRAEERAADQLVEEVFQADSQQEDAENGLALPACAQAKDEAHKKADSHEDRRKKKAHGVLE